VSARVQRTWAVVAVALAAWLGCACGAAVPDRAAAGAAMTPRAEVPAADGGGARRPAPTVGSGEAGAATRRPDGDTAQLYVAPPAAHATAEPARAGGAELRPDPPTPVTSAPRPARPAAGRRAAQGVPARDVTRGVTSRRAVALTFDAGADRGYAELILDVLRDEGVRATFGMTGAWAERNPDLVQRMTAEGHRLMNHSWDHSSFTGVSTKRRPLTQEQRWAQLDRTEALLVELTGQSTLPLFRAPYGDTDAGVLRDIGARGYEVNVLWTVDSRGWMGYSASAIVQRCLALAAPGAIYVMHVGAAAQDGPALRAVIAGLRAAGYSFETVDEILIE
jgi:peptidoglycan/xylan/chitin deacetylase (PgdA/CDA1 family)